MGEILLRQEGDRFVPVDWRPSFAALEAQPGTLHLIVSRHLRHSRTFTLYNRLFAARRAAALYLPYELSDPAGLPPLLDWARGAGSLRSLLVSDPWKQAVAARLGTDELTAEAQATGAVNLVLFDRGRVQGTNLDGPAAWEGLSTEADPGEVEAACLLGCGGVSTAVALAAPVHIGRLVLVDRNADAVAALAARIERARPDWVVSRVVRPAPVDGRGCGLVYNGTGLGKAGGDLGASPLAAGDLFGDRGLAWDANYAPSSTAFLAAMRGRGWTAINGLSHMLASTRHHLRAACGWEVDWQTLRALAR